VDASHRKAMQAMEERLFEVPPLLFVKRAGAPPFTGASAPRDCGPSLTAENELSPSSTGRSRQPIHTFGVADDRPV
jgi:hypothetical protein